jgi:putative transposase
MTKPVSPFRAFNSSPQVIRLVVIMYVKYPLSLRIRRGPAARARDRHQLRDPSAIGATTFAAEIRRKRVDYMRGQAVLVRCSTRATPAAA